MNILKLKTFCKDPTIDKFNSLPENFQLYLKVASEYCISKEIGNRKLARQIIIMHLSQTIQEDTRRDLRALFLTLKYIGEFPIFGNSQFPVVYLNFFKKDSYITISYSKELNEMYSIKLNNVEREMNSELNLYLDDAKEYFLELFNKYKNLYIPIIKIKLSEDKDKVIFYDKRVGVVYKDIECYNCRLQQLANKKLNSKCQELLDDDCLDDIRHQPKQNFKT